MSSMLWLMAQLRVFAKELGTFRIKVDMCAFGGLSRKPTLCLASGIWLWDLSRSGSGSSSSRAHAKLKGQVRHNGNWVFRTKLAQV